MPRTEPTEDATFSAYRVRAVCPKCGKEGETGALIEYPEDKVITAMCGGCVDKSEAGLKRLIREGGIGPIGGPKRKNKPDYMEKLL